MAMGTWPYPRGRRHLGTHLLNDETGNREYKRQLDRDDRFERAVVAFLNSRDGGTIYLGVEDDGSVCGVADLDLVQRQAADRVAAIVGPLEQELGRPLSADERRVFCVAVEERTTPTP